MNRPLMARKGERTQAARRPVHYGAVEDYSRRTAAVEVYGFYRFQPYQKLRELYLTYPLYHFMPSFYYGAYYFFICRQRDRGARVF